MIYILDVDFNNNIESRIFDILGIENTKIEATFEEALEIIEKKDYKAIFFSYIYEDLLKDLYKKEYNKKILIDALINTDDEIKTYNSLYEGFLKFINLENIKFENKTVLMLGSSKEARIIYRAIKTNENPTVFMASITEEQNSNLLAGDRKIKKIEIQNLQKTDYIINTTELGNISALSTCMLEEKNEIKAKVVIDLIDRPYKTCLLSKYEQKGAITYSGLLITVYKVLNLLSDVYNKDYLCRAKEVFEILKKEEGMINGI